MQNILLSCFFRCVNLCFCPGRWDGDRFVLTHVAEQILGFKNRIFKNFCFLLYF